MTENSMHYLDELDELDNCPAHAPSDFMEAQRLERARRRARDLALAAAAPLALDLYRESEAATRRAVARAHELAAAARREARLERRALRGW